MTKFSSCLSSLVFGRTRAGGSFLFQESLFYKRLPQKVKALSKWKSIDIQRINPDEPDYRRISSYLGKQTNLELIALDPFNSDLSTRKK